MTNKELEPDESWETDDVFDPDDRLELGKPWPPQVFLDNLSSSLALTWYAETGNPAQ